MGISKLNPSAGGIPYGNTAGRPAAATGKLYSNGETARLELYTPNGWQNIVQETPGVASITGNYSEESNSGTIVISGTNFVNGAYASAIGSNGSEVQATSTTYNSLVQLTAVFTGLSNAYEPYDIKVTNPSNLFGLIPDALYINAVPVWQTAAGSLGTFSDNISVSISAIATDDSTITYTLASGSTLPSGLTLNSSTGLISGTLPDVSSNTTYTFTINASDGLNSSVPRTFNFTVNAAPIWQTSSGSLGNFDEMSNISISLSATDPTDTVTYALAAGSSLPTGITLNSSTGVISGTLPDIASDTTYNFTINALDGVNTIPRSFSITSLTLVTAQLLVVAGGGAGGTNAGAGGGAGGLYYNSAITLSKAKQYSISIGSGGQSPGADGSNSYISATGFTTITALGGGGGTNDNGAGRSGGSGGGGAASNSGGSGNQPGSSSGGFGNPGGSGNGADGASRSGAGGGGAGAAGQNTPSNNQGGAGGIGKEYNITGTATYYAGGGGGSPHSGSGGAGGNGGGGAGGTGNTSNGTPGTANTGGGGGAGGGHGYLGANGGSGVIIIAYSSSEPSISSISNLTYDTPTRSGYRVYRFTAGTGTITI